MLDISLEYAQKIGKILVDIGGANPSILENNSGFILYLTEKSRWSHEYRFCGHLGSGGKFHSSWNKWSVSCYHESETPSKLKLIAQIDGELKKLYNKCENELAEKRK